MIDVEPRIKWSRGQLVEEPKVKPYTIVEAVGAGNIHIDEKGYYHVYFHRRAPDGTEIPVHHGGPDGFSDLDTVKRQHQWVIQKYIGLTLKLPFQQESWESPPQGQTLSGLAKKISIEIPGEQQIVSLWVSRLQGSVREIVTVRSAQELNFLKDELEKIVLNPLRNSINRYKVEGARILEQGLLVDTPKGRMLLSVNEAQMKLLMRAQESVAITVATMQRYNELEGLQRYWNNIVKEALEKMAIALNRLEGTPTPNFDSIVRPILRPDIGVRARLERLIGQPYKDRAQKIIKALGGVETLKERRDQARLTKVLRDQTGELAHFRGINQQMAGVDFGKFALS